MAILRFKCGRCGVDATRVGALGPTSVNAEDWSRVCVEAALAREAGEPADPLSVSCPYLNDDAVDAASEARVGFGRAGGQIRRDRGGVAPPDADRDIRTP